MFSLQVMWRNVALLFISFAGMLLANDPALAGKILFKNGASCYYVSPYFSERIHPTFSLYRNNVRIQGPFTLDRSNEYGDAPGRAGIKTPSTIVAGATYSVKVTCDATVYTIPIASQFSIPTIDLVIDNNAPVFSDVAVWQKLSLVTNLFSKVRQVPPASTVRLQFNVKDTKGGDIVPVYKVQSIYGTLVKDTEVKVATNEWQVRYNWTLPNSPGLYDVFISADDNKGGHTETSTKVIAKTGLAQTLLTPPAAVAKPSDKVPQLDQFLTFFSTQSGDFEKKGADSALSACVYYLDLGFAKSCSGNNMVTNISFSQWKANWGFDKTDNADKKAHAVYVNAADLGLERSMYAVYNNKGAAFYVCNHPFDADAQLAADPTLLRARSGDALVACVAMEYSVTAGFNSGKKFTKFLVFDPTGRLTRRVNLDGRGIKHIPNACTVCHGSTQNGGRYSETPGTGNPAFGSSFLPFDLDNFKFSTLFPYRKDDQQVALRRLNQFVRDKTGPAAAITELINGWYPTDTSLFNGSFVPSGWSNNKKLYNRVVKPACRTCHVAMTPASFNTEANFKQYDDLIKSYVCGVPGMAAKTWYAMPNAKVTFDRFWNSEGGVAGVNQPNELRDFLRTSIGDNSITCVAPH